MTFKIGICDDEISQVQIISDYLEKFSFKTDVEFLIDRFTDNNMLLKKYLNVKSPFHILFLDMEMPVRNGVELAQEIRKIPDQNVLIVFITNYPEYMQDSFDVQASQYFTKPISYELFEEKLSKLLSIIVNSEQNVVVLTSNGSSIVVNINDIVCIETMKKKGLKITTIGGEFFTIEKLSTFENMLGGKHFIAVHRTCIANMRHIFKFNSDYLEFTNGKTVSVSRRKLPEIKNAFSKYTVMRYKNNE